jgi:hypothetical protein
MKTSPLQIPLPLPTSNDHIQGNFEVRDVAKVEVGSPRSGSFDRSIAVLRTRGLVARQTMVHDEGQHPAIMHLVEAHQWVRRFLLYPSSAHCLEVLLWGIEAMDHGRE